MYLSLKGKVCLITGSTRGLGRVMAKRFAQEGAKVAINGRSEEDLQNVAEEIRKEGGEVLIAKADVSNSQEVNTMVDNIVERLGSIDIVINNAGGALNTNRIFSDITEADWDIVVNINLKGAFLVCKAVVPYMLKQKNKGKIINISSMAGRRTGRLAGVHYSSAKAGVQGLTRHLAEELAPEGILVNTIAPGISFSDRVKKLYESRSEEEKKRMLAGNPIGRWAEPEEIANVAVFLASGQSSYINGATIDVNGGAFMA